MSKLIVLGVFLALFGVEFATTNEIARGVIEALKHVTGEKFDIETFSTPNFAINDGRIENQFPPKIETVNGILTGVTFIEAHGFYGVPFGTDVSEENRFKEAKQATNYPSGELDVSANHHINCIQFYPDSCESCKTSYIEDCLVLNVHVPSSVDLTNSLAPPSERLPVLFWLHGGGFNVGSGSQDLYDGRYLSNITNTIVVSANYRLAPFGFLVYSDESETINGNQGLKDQQLALKWVQQNIHKFGGDKDQVTLFGQSAGAQSVMFHLLSNISAPLYNSAIMQSNPAIFKYPNVEQAQEITDIYMGFLNCTGLGIACLRAKDPKTLIAQCYKMRALNLINLDILGTIEPFRPVIDGIEFTDIPMKLFQQGIWNKEKHVIMGATTEEMYFVPVYIPEFFNITEEIFRKLNILAYGKETGDKASDFYIAREGNPAPDFDYQYVLGEEIGDSFFVCPTRTIARFASNTIQNRDVYFYSYAHGPNDPTCTSYWAEGACGHAFHAAENMPMFRTTKLLSYNFTDEDWNAANQLSYFWGNFAHSGNPNSGDVTSISSENFPDWPVYVEPESWTNIKIDSDLPLIENQLIEEVCDFWDSTGYYLQGIDTPEETTTPPITTSPTPTVTDVMETTTSLGETTTTGVGNTLRFSKLSQALLFTLFIMLCV